MAAASSSAPFFGRAREEHQNQIIQQHSSTATSSTVPTTGPQKKRRNQPGTPSKQLYLYPICQSMYQISTCYICYYPLIRYQSRILNSNYTNFQATVEVLTRLFLISSSYTCFIPYINNRPASSCSKTKYCGDNFSLQIQMQK